MVCSIELLTASKVVPANVIRSNKTWPWYQIGVPKQAAIAHLQGMPDGAFVVRSSETQSNWFALCICPVYFNDALCAIALCLAT